MPLNSTSRETFDKDTFKKLTSTHSEHGDQNVNDEQFQKLVPGYLLGPHKDFRLVRQLGKGGMGVTWLADELDWDGSRKQSVVCKILSEELINDEKAIRNILEVFDLTKKLNHTNICPLLNRFQDPVFKHFLVMRYAEGETLEQWFERQPGHENGLPMHMVFPILQQIASALDSMHCQSIIHRDVKPQNIMFSVQNPSISVPWLIDFGIAQAVNDSDPAQNRRKSGTPIFMAPEQHYGKPQDSHSDQYALAVTAFWLLTGHFPFTAETQEELSGKKMYPQSSLNPVASTLKSVFLRALAYDPKDRFASCGEFVNAMTQQKTSLTPQPAPISKPSDPFADSEDGEQKRESNRKFYGKNANHTQKKVNWVGLVLVGLLTSFFLLMQASRIQMNRPKYQYADFGNDRVLTKYEGNVRTVQIPAGVTIIGNSAFENNYKIEFVTIPNGVTSIENNAFYSCNHLESVTIPDSVTSIGDEAFYGCSDLTSVTIPNSVTNIGERAFFSCSGLTSVMIPDSVTSIGENAFLHCNSLTIFGKTGSKAESYAHEHEIPFRKIK